MATESAQVTGHPAETHGARTGSFRDLGWITLAVILAFATAVAGGFVWRDHDDILQGGYRITATDDWPALLTTTQAQYRSSKTGVPAEQSSHWRPVVALSLSLDWLLWQDRAWCYHMENILWHLLVVVGLYLLGRQLFHSLPTARRIVFWASLLFAVHPFATYSVAWISGRADTLCAFFGVGALLTLSHVVTNAESAQYNWIKTTIWLACSCCCLALSIGSKELGLVVPLVATALFWPGESRRYPNQHVQTICLASLGLCWLCATAIAIYRVVVVGGLDNGPSYPTGSLARNVATSANLWWHYIVRILTPYEIRPSDAWPIAQAIGLTEILAMVGILGLLAVLIVGSYRRWPWIPGLWWYVLWMVPASGCVPRMYFRAEASLYPASWGLLLVVVIFFLLPASRAESKRGRRAATAVLSAIASWLIITTAFSNTLWKNDSTLFRHALKQDSKHIEARMMLARLAFDRGELAETVRQLRQVVRDISDTNLIVYSDDYRVHTELGLALLQLQLNADALEEFKVALQHKPDNPTAHFNAGLAASALGNSNQAKGYYASALKLDPNHVICRHNLAMTLIRLGEAESCIELLGDHVTGDDGNLIDMADYTSALLALKRLEEAELYLDTLVDKQPENPIYRAQLAWCQWQTGKREEAKRTLEEARKKAPDHPLVVQVARIISQEQDAPDNP